MCSLWATVSTSPGPVPGITLSKAVAVLMRSCQVVNNKQTTCSVNNKQHPRQHQPPRRLPSTLPQGSALSAQPRPTISQLENNNHSNNGTTSLMTKGLEKKGLEKRNVCFFSYCNTNRLICIGNTATGATKNCRVPVLPHPSHDDGWLFFYYIYH